MVRYALSRMSRKRAARPTARVPSADGCRVLIMSVSAGAGHIKAANALEKTFLEDPRVSQVIHQDALVYTNKLFRDFYSKF
jgi:processive 1,2-diacylglycerol beta-glucosyltransferase